MRLEGGAMVTVDAADYAKAPYCIVVNGTLGRATVGPFRTDFILDYWGGATENWGHSPAPPSGMDRCVSEIVASLKDGIAFAYPAEEAVHTLEAIVAFHASHARNGAWVELPLTGKDRERVVHTG